MNKGFATTGILYTILVISITLMITFLMDLQNKKTILENVKGETVNAVDTKIECSYLSDELSKLQDKYKTLSQSNDELLRQLDTTTATKEDILEGKIAYSMGNLLTGVNKGYDKGYIDGQNEGYAQGYNEGIKSSTVKRTSLGNGNTQSSQSFSAKSIEGYQNFTVNNFGVVITGMSTAYVDSRDDVTCSSAVSYNANTGIFTVPKCNMHWNFVDGNIRSTHATYTVYVYY